MASSTSTFAAGGGKIITDFGGNDYGFGMAIQSDGKILVSGMTNHDFALARYNVDGSLDTTFSGDGKVTLDIGINDGGFGITVQNDGKILVSGASSDNFTTHGDVVLLRYNPDGSLDKSFSGDGKVITPIGGDAAGVSVTMQPDGKILIGGFSNWDFAVTRYNVDGTLDTSFSGDGIVTTNIGNEDYGCLLALQTDGKILASGSTWGSGGNFALVRYNSNGSLDTSFSGDGIVVTDINYRDQGLGITVQADGKILVSGESDGNFALVRYNTDGSLDTSFSGDGKVTTDIGNYDSGLGVTIQSNGKIIVAGYAQGGTDQPFLLRSDGITLDVDRSSDFALVRYNTDGSLDTNFGTGGKVTTDFGGNDIGWGVMIQSDGKIVVSGFSNGDFALARYNPDGSLDTSANTLGTTGNDTFHSVPGNETIDGLAGIDSVIFSGHQSDYTITLAGTGFALKDNVGTDDTDTLINIEKLQFADHTLTIAVTPDETLLESYRIYKAAFDRAPDYGGLGFWYHSMNSGESLTKVAEGFINSNEFKAMYGDNPTDSTFVSLLYQHVLGRTLDQGGFDFWMNDLKVETRAQVLAHFSESAENIANLVGVIANGIIYEEYPG